MTEYPTIPERDLELLSAYLDDELDSVERSALEQRLSQENDLRQALNDLRATVRLIAALPRQKAPRSFALDPTVYGRRPAWWRRALAAHAVLQWSGALGTAASVILIALGLALGSGQPAAQKAQAPADSAPPATAAAGLPTASAPAAPPREMFAEVPLAASASPEELAQAEELEAADAALAAPQAVPPGLTDGAAAPLAGANAFAPLPTPQADVALRAAPPAETFHFSDDSAASGSEPVAGAALMTATPTPAGTPPPQQAGEAAGPAPASPSVKPERKSPPAAASAPREMREPRWWLVALGVAGLALSAAIYIIGRHQAGT